MTSDNDNDADLQTDDPNGKVVNEIKDSGFSLAPLLFFETEATTLPWRHAQGAV